MMVETDLFVPRTNKPTHTHTQPSFVFFSYGSHALLAPQSLPGSKALLLHAAATTRGKHHTTAEHGESATHTNVILCGSQRLALGALHFESSNAGRLMERSSNKWGAL